MPISATESQSMPPSEVPTDGLRPPSRGRLGLMMLGLGVMLVGLLTVGAVYLVIRPDGPQVAIVGEDHKVHYRKVMVGRDYGTEIEITSGLAGTEALINNVTDTLAEATLVPVVGNHQQK